jgi:hypothetical protein
MTFVAILAFVDQRRPHPAAFFVTLSLLWAGLILGPILHGWAGAAVQIAVVVSALVLMRYTFAKDPN